MSKAVRLRVESIPEIAKEQEGASVQVLFSGGLDSTTLAALLQDLLCPKICIDLVNVSFSAASSPDRITSLLAFADLRARCPERRMRLLFSDHDVKEVIEVFEPSLVRLLLPKDSQMDFNVATALFLAARAENVAVLDETRWLESEFFGKNRAII